LPVITSHPPYRAPEYQQTWVFGSDKWQTPSAAGRIELAGGREGTSVELLVERDGEQQVIEVERKPLRR